MIKVTEQAKEVSSEFGVFQVGCGKQKWLTWNTGQTIPKPNLLLNSDRTGARVSDFRKDPGVPSINVERRISEVRYRFLRELLPE